MHAVFRVSVKEWLPKSASSPSSHATCPDESVRTTQSDAEATLIGVKPRTECSKKRLGTNEGNSDMALLTMGFIVLLRIPAKTNL